MTQIVTVTSEGPEVLRTDIDIRAHHVVADETKDANGESLGPEPHELLLAGLGACTAMTVRLYAARKGFPLERITVRLSRRKIKASECADCRTAEGEVEEMSREIELVGPLDETTRTRLLEIAEKCPVHRTLSGEIKIRTRLKPSPLEMLAEFVP